MSETFAYDSETHLKTYEKCDGLFFFISVTLKNRIGMDILDVSNSLFFYINWDDLKWQSMLILWNNSLKNVFIFNVHMIVAIRLYKQTLEG